MTGHSKIEFFVGFPSSVQIFFVIQHVPLNAWVSGNLDLKFHNLSPFRIFSIDFVYFKSTRGQIVNFKSK